MKFWIVIALWSFTTGHLKANSFEVRDPRCQIKVQQENDRLFALFLELLEEKGYRPSLISTDNPLYEGEMIASFEKEHLPGKIFKDCQIRVFIRRHQQNTGVTDPENLIVDHTSVRSLPRITFRGHERCTRGMRDAFVHVPPCVRPSAP